MREGPLSATGVIAWDVESLWERLWSVLPGISVEVIARCDSTNTVLVERARASSGWPDQPVTAPGALADAADTAAAVPPLGRRAVDTQPCLLVAEDQTQGRGRHGRPWQSARGASLTFSLALPLAPADWSGLSLAVGVALADALDPPAPGAAPRIGLKWPNDLWLLDVPGRGRKLGGVLIETVAVGRLRMAVIGVGLNVAPQALDGLDTGYACLHELDAGLTVPAALHRVALPLAQALVRYEREGFAAFAEDFARRDLLRDRPVTTASPAVPQGIALGVTASGALRVRAPDGQVHEIASGEVRVRPQDGAPT
jgi:BirA family biotin operon repressor/biotin-[acetyl-CoA-carboxylase] ligase